MKMWRALFVLALLALTACTNTTAGIPTKATETLSFSESPTETPAITSSAPPVEITPEPTEAPEPAPLPDPIFTPVAIPAELATTTPRLTETTLLSGTSTAPMMVVGNWSTSATTAELMTWTSPDGVAWTQVPLPTGVPGNLVSVSAASSDELTVVAGVNWDNGRLAAFVLTSRDRITWTPVALPPTTGQVHLGPVTVTGSTAYLVMVLVKDPATAEANVDLLYVLQENAVTVRPFPVIDQNQERGISAIAAHDGLIVVSGNTGPQDVANPLVVLTSPDQGGTWSGPITIAPTGNLIFGITWTGTYFAATGWQRPTLQDPARAAAWSSTDGLNWINDPIALPDSDSFTDPTDYTWFGVSAVRDGQVLAVMTSNSSFTKYISQRGSDGSWQPLTGFEQSVRPSHTADLAFVGPASSRIVAAVRHPNGVELVSFGITYEASNRQTLGTIEPVPSLSTNWINSQDLPGSGVEFIATTSRYDRGAEGGWWAAPTSAPFIWTPGAGLAPSQWDPPELATKESYTRYVDQESGEEVVMARGWNADRSKFLLTGYFRPSKGEAWQPITGFRTEDTDDGRGEGVDRIFRSQGRWYAVGQMDGPLSDDYAVIWVSDNGLDWTRAVENQAPQTVSWLSGSCLLSDGSPLFVGGVTDPSGVDHPLSWVHRDGTWVSGGLAAEEGVGYFNTCSTEGGITTVTASLEAATFFRTSDGLTFTEAVFDLGGGNLYSSTAVEGGYLGFGFQRVDGALGYGLWLSKDGSSGRWVPVPASFPYGSTALIIAGEDVLVEVSTSAGIEMWEVTGITEALG